MKILQYLSAVAVLLLAFSESTNIRTLQTIFYPDDGSIASEVKLCVCVLLANPSNEKFNCCCPSNDKANYCSKPMSVTFTLQISTNSWSIKFYLKKFLDFIQFTDLTLFNILSTLINYQDQNYLWLFTESADVNNITIVLSNTTDYYASECTQTYSSIRSLFKWVSVYYLKL